MIELETVKLSIKVSRPRFWFYLAGPYTVGCIYGVSSYRVLLKPWFFIYFFYFLVLANIFLYGVNDYWDYGTDMLNPKKDEKEYRVSNNERRKLRTINFSILGISVMLLLLQNTILQKIIFGLFVFLSYFYSAEPLRFKDKPILDSTSNFLYILPGVFAYFLASGKLPNSIILLAGFLHTFAMHLFSAIPDIEFDKKTGINTTAVIIGRNVSLLVCLLAWSGLSYIAITIANSNLSYLTLIYPIITANLLLIGKRVDSVYWFYPYINIGLGGLMFTLKAINTHW